MLRGSIDTGATRWLTRSRRDANGRARERRLGLRSITVAHLGGDVVGRFRHERRRAGRRRRDDVGDGGSLIVVDDDAVDGITRRFARFGDDSDDRLADEARHLVREGHAGRGRRRRRRRA